MEIKEANEVILLNVNQERAVSLLEKLMEIQELYGWFSNYKDQNGIVMELVANRLWTQSYWFYIAES